MEDILSAINNVEEYTKDLSEEQLKESKLYLHATIYNVQIIGEAVYKLTKDFKKEHPETPWPLIEKMRHILVHDYFRINFEILWTVIKEDIPLLKEQVVKYINELG